jgi:putative transposase
VTDTNVFQLSQPGNFADPLTEVLRKGARALLAQAVEAEVATLLSRYADETTDDGRKRLVRHGHLPEREIMTGIGPVGVRCPRVRDRVGEGSQRIRFSSAILPPYARRSKSLEVLIPILYLKGISTGDFEEALVALLGKDAGGLSASTVGRLKEAWSEEHTRWSKRDLSAKRYVYFWVDGIHVQARLEDDAQCLLVIIGATPVCAPLRNSLFPDEFYSLSEDHAMVHAHSLMLVLLLLGGRPETWQASGWCNQVEWFPPSVSIGRSKDAR